MTDEEKNLARERDRVRKQKLRQRKKEELRQRKKEELKKDLRRRKKDGTFAIRGEDSLARYRKKNSRKNRAEEEIEFDRIDTLLMMRKWRQIRDDEEHLLSNLASKKGMKEHREKGPLPWFDDMKRRKGEIEEEKNWRIFHQKGEKYIALLQKRKPELARKFKEEDDDFREKMKIWRESDRKMQEERERKEKELDKLGRWKYDVGNGEYFWSIPDENGHMKSLKQYDQECEAKDKEEREAKEALMTPEEKEEKRRKALEKKRKEKEEEEKMLEEEQRYYEQERRQERNRKQKERRDKQKEELAKPITMPEGVGKSKYEEARDETIRQRHDAMKESGLFTERDLERVLETIM